VLVSISDPPRNHINNTDIANATTNHDDNILRSLSSVILFTDTIYGIVLIIQVIFYIRLRKIFHPVHFAVEVGAVIFTAVFLYTDPSEYLAAVGALMCSWVALNLFSRYFDIFGLYTIMFYELLFKIIKVFFVGSYYIIGFGIILYILIGEEFLYDNPIKAIYASFYIAISRFNINIIAQKSDDDTLQYPFVTYSVIIAFNIVVSITLINLLIGIAVQQIGIIEDDALAYQAELKTQLFLELDPIIPKILKNKIFPKSHKVKGHGFDIYQVGGIWNRFTSLFKYTYESQENEQVMTNQKDHETQEMIDRIRQMENQIERILKILTIDSKK